MAYAGPRVVPWGLSLLRYNTPDEEFQVGTGLGFLYGSSVRRARGMTRMRARRTHLNGRAELHRRRAKARNKHLLVDRGRVCPFGFRISPKPGTSESREVAIEDRCFAMQEPQANMPDADVVAMTARS